MKNFLTLVLIILSGFNTCYSQWTQTDGPYDEINVETIIPYDSLIFSSTACGYFTKNSISNPWEMNSSLTFSGYTRVGDSLFVGGEELRLIDLSNPNNSTTILNSIDLKKLSHSDSCLYGGNYSIGPFDNPVTGFFKSNDYGITWTVAKNGLPIDSVYNTWTNSWSQYWNVKCISVTTNYIFCGTNKGIYRSTGDLILWGAVNSGLPLDAVSFIESFNDTLYTAIDNNLYTSNDFGNNWNLLFTAPTPVTSFIKTGTEYYLGTVGNGIYFSNNQGQTWNTLNTGLTDLHVTTISLYNSSIICGTYTKGIFYYQGGQWYSNISGMICSYIRTLTSTDSVIYSNNNDHIYVLKNGQWSEITPNINNDVFLILDKMDDTVFVSSFYTQPNYPYNFLSIFYSADQGSSWSQITSLPYDVPVGDTYNEIYIHNNRIYGYAGDMMFSTDNMGVSWTDLTLPSQFCNNLYDVLVFDSIPFATTCGSGQVLKLDSTQQWVAAGILPSGPPPVSLAYCDSALFVYLEGQKMYVSFNKGDNWVEANNGLLAGRSTNDFVSYNSNLFVTSDSGVFVTSNYGQNWYPINDGLKNLRVGGIELLNDTLYIGTYGNGVWKQAIMDIGLGIEENPKSLTSVKIFPNPFSTQTTLQTDNSFKNATLTIYNVWGQKVKEKENLSGSTLIIQRDNLPSGLYFIRMSQNNKTVLTDRLIISD
jgi:photosystem II stability/assembly factor-like uncharacterized protein